MELTDLKGIGEKTKELFQKVGIKNVEELKKYYPRTYDVFRETEPIEEIDLKTIGAVEAVIISTPFMKKIKNLVLVTVEAKDQTGTEFSIRWFNMPYVRNQLYLGQRAIFRGMVQKKGIVSVMEQPVIYTIQEYQKMMNQMQPIYALTKGLTNGMVTKAVKQAFDSLPKREDYLPSAIKKEYQLCDLDYAEKKMHFPENLDNFLNARKRMAFDEFFFFVLALKRFKKQNISQKNNFKIENYEKADALLRELPYQLTNAQKKVYEEIKKDMSGESMMNRLIQGDVGSGKTIVAILALIAVAEQGYQGALMAPTEVLAVQHYKSTKKLLEEHGFGYLVVMLTGSMKAKEKREAYEKIKNGEAKIIIGTHALIQEKVEFAHLALVITDEQHRFGVKQRECFGQKGENPHILVMSATPIPRTLAIILYGDLDISIIDELPANRLPIKNCVVGTDYRRRAYAFILDEIKKGHQAYVICPLATESENLEAENVVSYCKKMKEYMPDNVVVEYLHGKLHPTKKNEIMERFKKNEIQVLVSTTVIEVGINVPNATVMMVEDAQRFGLAGLHQLRGRVGRGKAQSYCIFISGTKKNESVKRLKILNESNDGFYIAQQDLKLRGPGDLFGIRQSGDFQFQVGDIIQDATLLQDAASAVWKYEQGEFQVEQEEVKKMEKKIQNMMQKCLEKVNL